MIDLKKLWEAMPRDVQRKISCHDLKRIVDNYNTEPKKQEPEVFATTLRRLKGTICVIEKGTRVKVSGQCDINKECRIDLLHQDNPSRIWNCIVGVPMKYLQFDSQNA